MLLWQGKTAIMCSFSWIQKLNLTALAVIHPKFKINMKSAAFSKAGRLCITQLICLNMSPRGMYPYLHLYRNSVPRMWTSVIKKKKKECRLKNTILINIYQFLSSIKGKHIVSPYLTPAGIYKFILQAASFFFLSSSWLFFHADMHHGRVCCTLTAISQPQHPWYLGWITSCGAIPCLVGWWAAFLASTN